MGKHKDRTGKTLVGSFLQGVKKVAPDLLNIAGSITGVDSLNRLGDAIRGTDTLTETEKVTALELLSYDVENTRDARDMQKIALQQDDLFSKRFIYYYAIIISLSAIALIFMMFFIEIPEDNKRIVDMTIGILIGTGLVSVINFFFGSSSGSKEKSKMMKQ